MRWFVAGALAGLFSYACTRAAPMQRSDIEWTGEHGVLDVTSKGRVVMRIIEIERLRTHHVNSKGKLEHSFHFGYGILDQNQNFEADDGERSSYFEVGEAVGNALFYQRPDT